MRILFISSTFPDSAAPARGTYNSALCCALAEEHQVHALAPRTYGEAFAAVRKARRFRRTEALLAAGVTAEYPTYWYTPRVFRSCYGAQMWWSMKERARRALRDFQPHAVLSYWAHPEGEVGLRAAREAGIPAAVIVGGSDVLLLPYERGRGEAIRRVLHESSAVIAISQGLMRAAISLGTPPAQVHTVYQGVDPRVFYRGDQGQARARLNIPRHGKVLLWVGRMVPVKGLNVLIEAFARLNALRGDARLYLLGDGPLRADVDRQILTRGLAGRVQCVGAVGEERVGEWYRAADATVLSSHSEGLPNVLRESLACGTPFVSTDVGSIREIADQQFSQLVPADHVAALAEGMHAVLNPCYRAAATAYQPRTWQECAAEVAGLLERLIHNRTQLLVARARARQADPITRPSTLERLSR